MRWSVHRGGVEDAMHQIGLQSGDVCGQFLVLADEKDEGEGFQGKRREIQKEDTANV